MVINHAIDVMNHVEYVILNLFQDLFSFGIKIPTQWPG